MAKSDITDIASILIIGGVAYYVLSQPTALQKLTETFQNLFKGGGIPSISSTKEKGGSSGSPITGSTLWDSNRDGKWNNGKKRTVTDTEGSQSPNGKGLFMAASGNPRLIIDGDGVAHLEADGGRGRVYIKATNFNSMLSGEFMFETASIDNITLRLRSRRNEGGSCQNRFGGFGATVERDAAEYQTESCRNERDNSIKKPLATKLQDKKWYGFKYSCSNSADNKTVNFKTEYDYHDGKGFITVGSGSHPKPHTHGMDEATFMKESYIWLRINNSSTGRVAFKNIRLTKIDNKSAKLVKRANLGRHVMNKASCPFNQDDCTG